MKKLHKLFFVAFSLAIAAMVMFTACTKEGPQGPAGPAGKDGTNGKDANETCKVCHAANVVDRISVEFQMAKHSWGEAAFEEAGNTTCAPCHEQKAYIYAVKNNLSSEFVFNSTTKKWVNSYIVPSSEAIGEIGCFTCHSSLHTTYGDADIALTTTAPVSMTMRGGAKTINLAADNGSSNLCVKCHQPRPMICGNDPAGRLLNYDSLVIAPNIVMYDSTAGATNIYVRPSYRMHIHYGAVGAVVAGTGAIEYAGSLSYSNSAHTTLASCSDCHMADPMTGVAGGHSFNVRNGIHTALGSSTSWNFNGCNVEGCHLSSPLDASSAKFKDTRTSVKALLDELATKINEVGSGHDILHKESDPTLNLWAGVSTGNYDGYMDIYDASANPDGYWRNPYNTSATNMAKPKFPSLLNKHLGAIINFQFCLREYSLGIHNAPYVKALLTNTIEQLENPGK